MMSSARLGFLKAWHLVLVVGIIVLLGGLAYTVYARSTTADQQSLGENQQLVAAAYGDLINQVSTNGTLIFPEKETLIFGTGGIIAGIFVEEGQRVEEMEVVAQLDPLTVVGLEQEVAQAKLNLQTSLELLEEVSRGYTGLELAEANQGVADAEFQVQEAQEALEEAKQPFSEEEIQTQRNSLAAARVSLRDALDELENLKPDNNLLYAEAVQARTTSQAALEAARRNLAEFEIDHAQSLAEASQAKADWEVAREAAQTALARYEEQTPLLNIWRAEAKEAEDNLEKSLQRLSKLREEEGKTGGLQGSIRQVEGFIKVHQETYEQAQENVAEVQQLEADLELAQASLRTSREELEQLKFGPDPLDREELEAQVRFAEADLQAVEQALKGQRPDVDPLDASLAESQVALAQATVAKAEEDLAELLEGADQLEVALRERGLEVAKAVLDDALESLAELLSKPDPLELAVTQSEVAAARQELADAEARLANTTMRAPFSGLVTAVLVEAGDEVGARGAIVEISDTTLVEVDGIVDEVDVLSLRPGAKARVSLDALPGRPIEGTLSEIAPAAQNQQGVVSYPIRITLSLPGRMQPREGLSAVANIILKEEQNVLRIPQQALRGSFQEPTVKVQTANGGLEERLVTVGDTDGYWVAVTEGLEEGEQVVVESASAATTQFNFRQLRGSFGGAGGGPSGGGRGGPR